MLRSGEAPPPDTSSALRLPSAGVRPAVRLLRRLAVAIGLTLLVAAVAYLDRDGYRDAAGGEVGLLDAVYYATVSITTTGYGDITPVSDSARLLTTLVVTPARVLFLILLVGTTLEVLAESSRAAIRERIWRRKLRNHVIVCGFGTKGRSAIEVLHGHGRRDEEILVIDPSLERVEEATRAGYAAMQGDASRASVLAGAGVDVADAIVVATDRDDTNVLVTLTAREHNREATIIAAVRESANRHLLHQSGADSVITSSEAAGRLLGFAVISPRVVEVLEDLLSVGTGLDLVERTVSGKQVGLPLGQITAGEPIIGVIRGERLLRFDDPRIGTAQRDDRLVCLCSNKD